MIKPSLTNCSGKKAPSQFKPQVVVKIKAATEGCPISQREAWRRLMRRLLFKGQEQTNG